jgi:hypothetical protein
MKSSRKTLRRRRRGETAMELLAAYLIVPDEAARYAERIERLGQAIFGELWRSDETNSESEALDPAGCEHLGTARDPGRIEERLPESPHPACDHPHPLPRARDNDRGGGRNNS